MFSPRELAVQQRHVLHKPDPLLFVALLFVAAQACRHTERRRRRLLQARRRRNLEAEGLKIALVRNLAILAEGLKIAAKLALRRPCAILSMALFRLVDGALSPVRNLVDGALSLALRVLVVLASMTVARHAAVRSRREALAVELQALGFFARASLSPMGYGPELDVVGVGVLDDGARGQRRWCTW